jgi:cytochrome c-type biogenesis protein CcmH/NrfG
MDVVLFCGAVLLLSAFVAAPLYRRNAGPAAGPRAATGRREWVFRALRDLEIDRASGLIDEQVYEGERKVLETQAVTLDEPTD